MSNQIILLATQLHSFIHSFI